LRVFDFKRRSFSFRKTPPVFCLQKRLRILTGYDDQRLPAREPAVLFPESPHFVAPAITRSPSCEGAHIADENPRRVPPSELARLLPARAASENVLAVRSSVKGLCDGSQKKFRVLYS
jgi:hypothetical protein